jgi:hypothetical protein
LETGAERLEEGEEDRLHEGRRLPHLGRTHRKFLAGRPSVKPRDDSRFDILGTDRPDVPSAPGRVKKKVLPFPSVLSAQMRPPVRFHDSSADVEPQPEPSAVTLGDLPESLEDGVEVIGRDACARV